MKNIYWTMRQLKFRIVFKAKLWRLKKKADKFFKGWRI